MQAFVIALDGPAASGKSTVGLGIAERLGYTYFDTGLLYRALTWLALQEHVDPHDAHALLRLVDDLNVDIDKAGGVSRNGADITDALRLPEVNAHVSAVSAHAPVRDALRPVQRALIRPPGLVMVGRDIGTVIVPDAPLKIWLNASVEERARRRSRQTGEDYAAVLEGMLHRDRRDGSRAVAPMARAADAIGIETDGRTPDAVIDEIVELARARARGRASAGQ
ncbi:MAG: (d)CMP kinase [Chloroflexi bacterium]|nr:(d)CMP kinase [Chloroflexota bacterium]